MRIVPSHSVVQMNDGYMGWSLFLFRRGEEYKIVETGQGSYFFYDLDEAWDYAKSATVPKEWDSIVVKAVKLCNKS